MYDELEWIMQYIDVDIIKAATHINFWHKYYLRKVKHKMDATLKVGSDGVPAFYFGEEFYQNIHPGTLDITY